MSGAWLPLTIEPGTTFELSFVWSGAATPINLGNYQAEFNLREARNFPAYLTSSTQNGLAASTPTTGALYFSLTPGQTTSIPFNRGYYEVNIYTLAATPYIRRLLKGTVDVDRT